MKKLMYSDDDNDDSLEVVVVVVVVEKMIVMIMAIICKVQVFKPESRCPLNPVCPLGSGCLQHSVNGIWE